MNQPPCPPLASFQSVVWTALMIFSATPNVYIAESAVIEMCQYNMIPFRLVMRAALALMGKDIELPTEANILTPSLN